MNFNELTAEVLSITKRPDLQTSIENAVRAATIKAHNQDFFYRDLVETGISFAEESHIQNFLPAQIFGNNFRKIKYIRYWIYDVTDPTFQGRAGDFLDALDTENSVDAYGYNKTNVYYLAGELIQIRTSMAATHFLTAAYVYPTVVTPETFKSWIADFFPYAIIYEACRRMFIQIGKTKDAQSMAGMVAEEYIQLKINAVNKPGE